MVAAGYENDVALTLPDSQCGGAFSAGVELTYRLGDSEPRRSVARAQDRYGAITAAMDRDCARQRLRTAAKLEVGRPPSSRRLTGQCCRCP